MIPLLLMLAAFTSAEPLDRAPALSDMTAPIFRMSTAPRAPRPCGNLDFTGVTWPARLTPQDHAAYRLALEVTSSFEGGGGWATISDGFDGQGLSLGLLNQNLGQGTLQPLLIRLRKSHPQVLRRAFSAARFASLSRMLDRWEGAGEQDIRMALDLTGATPSALSPLDEPPFGPEPARTPADEASVAWAHATVYVSGRFDPAWRAELTALAATPEYRSLQVEAALDMIRLARLYQKLVDVVELRGFLMLFDVVVQNGKLHDEDLVDYRAYLRGAPRSSTTARLTKLLELRLRHVRARYAADVRARKLALIHGAGRVHGRDRTLTVEYCYDGTWPYL